MSLLAELPPRVPSPQRSYRRHRRRREGLIVAAEADAITEVMRVPVPKRIIELEAK